ncbi:calcium-activated potassium channel subunit beta-3 [Cebus imitator]|uniref:calcium-activated potassium channel subunit beta-3 n=1 Tax=Cebus imitator TaxID=2715852 RepID=UPI0018991E64|nr:calcium-activated potassium channel subunit beta-3 [Cebus imitator]
MSDELRSFDEPQHLPKEYFLHKFQCWRERLLLLRGSRPDECVQAVCKWRPTRCALKATVQCWGGLGHAAGLCRDGLLSPNVLLAWNNHSTAFYAQHSERRIDLHCHPHSCHGRLAGLCLHLRCALPWSGAPVPSCVCEPHPFRAESSPTLYEAVQINPKCFYTPKCHQDRNDLLSSALDIKAFFDHKNGTAFSCFYSLGSQAEDVILIKQYDQMAIFHCFLWPSLTLLAGALIVGMVRLTQHLSSLCEKYSNAVRGEVGGKVPYAEQHQFRLKCEEEQRNLQTVAKLKCWPSDVRDFCS